MDSFKSHDRRAPLGVILDKIVVYVFTGLLSALTLLLSWLCLATISLKQDTTKILEHNAYSDDRLNKHDNAIQGLIVNDHAQMDAIEAVRLKQAQHGWR